MNNDEIVESVIGFDALYDSMLKCKRGVLWKNSVAHYYLNGVEETLRLEHKLRTGQYEPKPPKKFMVTSPKPREIVSITFRDRVYQRSLNDNVLYPVMTKSFVESNMACQKGKGTDFARRKLDEYLHKYYRRYGLDGYVLQCDIHGYYPNMSHHVTEMTFKEKLPKPIYDRTLKILRHQYDGDKGYNPGSQMIQIAGISVLDKMDHYIKEQLHIKYYIRYMDDFILIHHDEQYLIYCKIMINKFLEKLEFELHPEKTKIYKLKKGIKMLGFTHRLTQTGKVIRILDPNNVRRERKKLRRMVHKSKRGEMDKAKVDMCYSSWKAHASKGNSFKLLQRMDKYYKELWERDDI